MNDTFSHIPPRRGKAAPVSRLSFALILFLLFLVACGGNDEAATLTPDPAIPPTATFTPAETLAQAAAVMLALEGVQIEFSRTGGNVYLDEDGLLIFSSATVVYDAPDKVQARVKALTSNTALEMGFIAIGEDKWLTNPATQAWERLPDNIQLDLALLFDETEGWRPLLTSDATNIQLVETTTFGDVTRNHYRATIAGERAAAITSNLVPPKMSPWIFLWIRLPFTSPNWPSLPPLLLVKTPIGFSNLVNLVWMWRLSPPIRLTFL